MHRNAWQLLKKSSLFSSCSAEDLDEILALSGRVEFRKDECIFSAGDASESLYVVEDGEVLIRRRDDEGRQVDIARFLPGDFFGELDMITGESRNASAYSAVDSTLLVFPGEGRTYDNLPQLPSLTRARLLHSFLVQISARIRSTNDLVKENSPVVQELKRQVYVDKLTGLSNRTCFDEQLAGQLASGTKTGLIMFKPDNFKTINDTFGHEAGDKVLRLTAERLSEWVPDRSMLFRYMGNENALIFSNSSREQLSDMSRQIGLFLLGMDLSSVTGNEQIRLSASFGMVLSPEHGSSAESLVEMAHSLTMEGRRRGGNKALFPEDLGAD